jgi:hypothetical protein
VHIVDDVRARGVGAQARDGPPAPRAGRPIAVRLRGATNAAVCRPDAPDAAGISPSRASRWLAAVEFQRSGGRDVTGRMNQGDRRNAASSFAIISKSPTSLNGMTLDVAPVDKEGRMAVLGVRPLIQCAAWAEVVSVGLGGMTC